MKAGFPVDLTCEACRETAKYTFLTPEARNEYFKLWNKRHEKCPRGSAAVPKGKASKANADRVGE